MFVNFSNHPHSSWCAEQLAEAEKYGEIVDILFPHIPPDASEEDIAVIGSRCVSEIISKKPSAVMCQGEFCLSYWVISALSEKNIPILAACSERICVEENNIRKSIFKFRRFRQYRKGINL